MLYDKIGEVIDIYKFSASQIWNVDETGVSGERGSNVTVVTAISASGNTVPPMFVFLCKNYKDYFVKNGPPGCMG